MTIYANPLWVGAVAFDPGAVLWIPLPDNTTQTDNANRRISKVTTLDGDISLTDAGYTEGDKTFRIVISGVTVEQVDIANRMVALHPQVRVSKRDGAWLCSPESVIVNGEQMTLTAEVIRKLTNG